VARPNDRFAKQSKTSAAGEHGPRLAHSMSYGKANIAANSETPHPTQQRYLSTEFCSAIAAMREIPHE
jgi:hypothetical protein